MRHFLFYMGFPLKADIGFRFIDYRNVSPYFRYSASKSRRAYVTEVINEHGMPELASGIGHDIAQLLRYTNTPLPRFIINSTALVCVRPLGLPLRADDSATRKSLSSGGAYCTTLSMDYNISFPSSSIQSFDAATAFTYWI